MSHDRKTSARPDENDPSDPQPPEHPEHEGDGSRGAGRKHNVQLDPEDQRARPDPKETGNAPRRQR